MPTKSYYKIGEIAEMLGVSIYTLKYWETQFDELDPPRLNKQRRYTPADIEIVKRIMELLYKRKFKIEAAKEAMRGYRRCKPRRMPVCRSKDDALNLLSEIKTMTQDEHILVRVEAVEAWIAGIETEEERPRPIHKNIRGKEYFAESIAQKKNKQKE